MNRSNVSRRAPLALALCLALAAPGLVLAQNASPQDLEARIAQLEQMVQGLKSELEAQKAAQAAQPAPAPLPAGAQPIQATTIMPAANAGTKFSFGGFIKLDAMYTNTDGGEIADGSTGRLFYVPGTIPVGAPGADEGTDLDMHAQFSRLWFGADTDINGHKVKGYLEMDLFGGALGNETSTNTYGVTIRHAYVSWDKWLAGQTWSNFQDVAALPDSVDFVGPTEGTIFVRQAQIRYTNGPWSFSIENPETLVNAHLGTAKISSDDNYLPDLTARYLHKGSWGHFTVAGLARQLKYETAAFDESETAFALSVSGKWTLGANDDIRYMLTGGSGIGRYIGLALNNDAVLDSTGDLDNIDVIAGFVGWRHVFSPKLRTNLFYSRAEYDQDTDLTGLGITKGAQSAHVNLIYTPLPKLDLGAELIWGQRELENGDRGELNRLQTHVKYNF